MNAVLQSARDWSSDAVSAWDRFWFKPARPHTLALIRILGGAMMFYTHLVWTLDLEAFLGPHSWLSPEVARGMQGDSPWAWSYLGYASSPAVLWTLHLAALVVFAMLTLGLFSRVASVLACFITLMYCHRLEGALFGLDQVNAMLSLYLMIGPCGAVYSLDRLIRRGRAGGPLPEPAPSVSANVAIRLIQLHMCVIYLFGGIGKMRGDTWWLGNAFWFSIANSEYQSLDVTWLGRFPAMIALLSHVTVLWETFYCFLVWPRLTRPICLAMAVAVHGGIALCLGMITFGLAMLIGNLAFVSPETVRGLVARLTGILGRAGQGSARAEIAAPAAASPSRHAPHAPARRNTVVNSSPNA